MSSSRRSVRSTRMCNTGNLQRLSFPGRRPSNSPSPGQRPGERGAATAPSAQRANSSSGLWRTVGALGRNHPHARPVNQGVALAWENGWAFGPDTFPDTVVDESRRPRRTGCARCRSPQQPPSPLPSPIVPQPHAGEAECGETIFGQMASSRQGTRITLKYPPQVNYRRELGFGRLRLRNVRRGALRSRKRLNPPVLEMTGVLSRPLSPRPRPGLRLDR